MHDVHRDAASCAPHGACKSRRRACRRTARCAHRPAPRTAPPLPPPGQSRPGAPHHPPLHLITIDWPQARRHVAPALGSACKSNAWARCETSLAVLSLRRMPLVHLPQPSQQAANTATNTFNTQCLPPDHAPSTEQLVCSSIYQQAAPRLAHPAARCLTSRCSPQLAVCTASRPAVNSAPSYTLATRRTHEP